MKNKQDTIRISALSLMLTLAAAGATFTMGEFDAYASTILKVNRSSLAAAQTPAVAQPSANAHWESSDGYNWKYRRADGSYATGWVRDEATNDWYYMDAQGNMKTGLISDGGYSYLLSNQHDGRYGHMVRNGESFNGHTIKAWTAGSGNPEGALMGDAENDRAIKDSGNYYVYNTASGTLTYVDSLGGSTSYNTAAQETPKRIEDVPPANVDTAQDERYTWNPEYPPIDDGNSQISAGVGASGVRRAPDGSILTPEQIAMIERAEHDAVIISDYDPNRDAGILH